VKSERWEVVGREILKKWLGGGLDGTYGTRGTNEMGSGAKVDGPA
jgi:hypothetical protein